MRRLILAFIFLLSTSAHAAISTVSASADQALSSTTDATVNNMTLTPSAGDYLAIFTAEIDVAHTTTTDVQIITSLYVNAVQVTATERTITFNTSEDSANPVFHMAVTAARVTPTAGQAVDVRYRKVGTENQTMKNRTLTLLPYAGANFSQATDTVTDTIAVSAETLMDSMTITPGSGDYLAVFSTSFSVATDNDVVAFMLYANGAKVAHTERTFLEEASLGGETFNVLIAAKVSPGAGAVEARWARQVGTGTVSGFSRILTLVKMDFANDIVEGSATGDVTSTSSTFAAFSTDLTTAPIADEYLAIFSGSQQIGTIAGGNDQQVDYAVFVNGVENTNSKYAQSHEDSFDSWEMPVFTHAVVSPTAGQAVNVQWRTVAESSILTRTERERTLVLVRESDGSGGPTCTAGLSLPLLGVGGCP